MHENGLQRKNVGPLVTRLGRRAAAVLLINRSSTARCVPRSGLRGSSFLRASEWVSRMVVLGCKWAIDPQVHRPAAAPSRRAPTRPAPPHSALPAPPLCAARLRPTRNMTLLWIGKYCVPSLYLSNCYAFASRGFPQAGRGGAAKCETAGRGGVGQDGTPTSAFAKERTAPPALQGIVDNCPERLCGSAEKRKSYIKTDGDTQGAVNERFIRGTASALRSWLLTSGPSPFSPCKHFSCKAYRELPNGHSFYK